MTDLLDGNGQLSPTENSNRSLAYDGQEDYQSLSLKDFDELSGQLSLDMQPVSYASMNNPPSVASSSSNPHSIQIGSTFPTGLQDKRHSSPTDGLNTLPYNGWQSTLRPDTHSAMPSEQHRAHMDFSIRDAAYVMEDPSLALNDFAEERKHVVDSSQNVGEVNGSSSQSWMQIESTETSFYTGEPRSQVEHSVGVAVHTGSEADLKNRQSREEHHESGDLGSTLIDLQPDKEESPESPANYSSREIRKRRRSYKESIENTADDLARAETVNSSPSTAGDATSPEASSAKKRRGGALRKKLYLSEVIKQEHDTVKNISSPTYPHGIQHYVVTKSGDYFDPRFNTEGDLRRWSCQHVSGLQILGPQTGNDKLQFRTEIFPFSKNTNDPAHYWLTSAVIQCSDYDVTAKKLKSGVIQAAIRSFGNITITIDRMWLLILLRLAASCKPYGHLLLYEANDIYQFLLSILQQTNEHFEAPVKKWYISDSRGYESFLMLGLAAHSRPVLTSTEPLPFRREVMYRNHVRLICRAYSDTSNCRPGEVTSKLSPRLTENYKSLTMHDMALEIFIDLAKYGLFAHFASSVMNSRWAKVLNQALNDRPFDLTTVQLCQVLHNAPRAVASRLDSPYGPHDKCYYYLSWSLNQILENEFYQPASNKKVFVPIQFAIACAKALTSMMGYVELNESSKEMVSFLRRESVQIQLVRYVLIAPFCRSEFVNNDENKELYESIWSLIHTIGYTFPLMLDTLIDYACDEDAPLCLTGHAAMFVGSMIAFTKHKVTRTQLSRIRDTLRAYATEASTSSERNLRLELAFRLGIFLEAEKYELKEYSKDSIQDSNSDDETNSRVLFTSYVFKEESDNEKIANPRKLTVDAISIIQNGGITANSGMNATGFDKK